MKYAIYLTSGTYPDTAKPVRGLIEVSDLPAADFATRLADQVALLDAGEATIQVEDTAVLTDLDSDANTYDYTVDITDPVPVALTPVSVARFSLEQKQGFAKERRDQLIQEAILASNFDRFISDADLSTYATYISSLRGISATDPDPDNISWPTLGTINGDSDRILNRQYRKGNILAAVGFNGSVPSGGIIETATNANGLYIRFADGGQICRARILPAYFSGVRMATSWTFPASFHSVSSYSFLATFSNRNNSNTVDGLADTDIEECTIISQSRSTTSIDIHVLSHTYTFVAGDDVWLDILAIGRWVL